MKAAGSFDPAKSIGSPPQTFTITYCSRLASGLESWMHRRMPYLNVSTNAEKVSAEAAASFLKEASNAVATGAGKPEQYVMVKVAGGEPMLFAGSNQPAAFMEMKSIGFPAFREAWGGLAATLTDLVAKHLGRSEEPEPSSSSTDVKAPMWGQNGETFG